jgi:FkbM family methyltransferase
MFNICDSKKNGEYLFFLTIKTKIQTIFDVGSRSDSEFTEFNGEVHYFEPVKTFIDLLQNNSNINTKSYFNNFGLGDETKDLFYYPRYQSFIDRTASCTVSDESNKITLSIRKGKDYMIEHNIQGIDFLKIDTEGYELQVLQGFEELLSSIKLIQFEYGGTFIDSKTKLIDVIEYLMKHGFYKFSYLTPHGTELITDFSDHYQYCNIVCIHENSTIIPF